MYLSNISVWDDFSIVLSLLSVHILYGFLLVVFHTLSLVVHCQQSLLLLVFSPCFIEMLWRDACRHNPL